MQTQPRYPNVYLYRRVVNAKLFIDTNYHEPINLDDIADEAFFSKFHFIRLFRAAYNYTPHQYLTRVRVDKASLLLQKGTSVSQTCYAVGFDSVPSFSALFKKVFKLSPALYRQRALERRKDILLSPHKYIPNCFAEKKGWV
ncbi:helix-turn-helix domain-containing protein [Mucilaginibacter ginkgonis]|uniref:Helix-turn-helix transcriptional regulator n=1 Tax=Mucilaginibacter ginkgonis TaxID=2682091 RepID=A0A6I4I269_9SPHI|nr:AraC family transcriptional regulator [Mucilaginibacter ginkgonis]QQL50751.1 helix-turn-helix transcriptional regulator [Mucilaginibacter ginkgonis]